LITLEYDKNGEIKTILEQDKDGNILRFLEILKRQNDTFRADTKSKNKNTTKR